MQKTNTSNETTTFDTKNVNKFDWSMFGEHVYIVHASGTNVSEARYNSTKAQLSRLDLLNRTTFHSKPLHPKGGHFGCWKAHKEIAHNALSQGYKRIMIFEDDIVFNEAFLKDYKKYLEPAAALLSTKEDWEVFYFTHNIFSMQLLNMSWAVQGVKHELIKAKSWGAVGYSIQSTALHWLAYSAYFNLPEKTVDGILHLSRAYSMYPMPATHPDNWSRTTEVTREIKWTHHQNLLYAAAQKCPRQQATMQRSDFNSAECGFS